jgi:hypothetical protein
MTIGTPQVVMTTVALAAIAVVLITATALFGVAIIKGQ